MEVVAFAVQLVLNIVLTAWVVRYDERRLDATQRARSWPPASFWAAVVSFGPLAIPVHFVRTRRSLGGIVLGVGWAAGVLAALVLVQAGFEWASG